MRLFLAILGWGVMGLGVVGALLSLASVGYMASTRGLSPTLMGFTYLSTALNGLFRVVQAVTIGLGVLYLLDVDKRVRANAAVKETF